MVRKLQELSVYTVGRLRRVYRLQLAKLVYLVDWESYQILGRQISDANYFRIKMGPCPRHFDSILEQCNGYELAITKIPSAEPNIPDSYLHEMGPRPRFHPSFSSEELRIIDLILDLHGSKSGKQLLPIVYNTRPMLKILQKEAEMGMSRTVRIDFAEFPPSDPLAKYRAIAAHMKDETVGSPEAQAESDMAVYEAFTPYLIRANKEA